MASIVGPEVVAQSDTIVFTTTGTLRNQIVNFDTTNGFFISKIGRIYGSSSAPTTATVTLEGGLDTFVNAKKVQEPIFYMTTNQKLAIYNILRALAKRTPMADVSSDNDSLDLIVKSTYFNYCG
jgi:hypothetical protein